MNKKRATSVVVVALFLLFLAVPTWADDWNNKDWPYANPSGASTKQDNYLVERKEFTMSYSNAKGTPNWTAWSLQGRDIGKAPRMEFYPDQDLPRSFKRVMPGDYSKSGFDRGHLCNHEDRSSTHETSHATFTMANMMPQAPDVNRKAWEKFESYCRKQVKRGGSAFIICGPAGVGGVGSEGSAKTIGKGREITVPAWCWKIAVFKSAGGEEKTVAIIMPNKMGVGEDWKPYQVDVSAVEKLTGYRFGRK